MHSFLQISAWAARNPIATRILIGVGHVLIVLLSLIFGLFLALEGINISEWVILIPATLFSLLYLFYPEKIKENQWFTDFYWRQKVFDFLLVIAYATTLSIATLNFIQHEEKITQNDGAFFYTQDSLVIHLASMPDPKIGQTVGKKNKRGLFKQVRQLKKKIKEEVRQLRKARKAQPQDEPKKGSSGALKALFVFLTIFLTVILAMAIAAGSCSLACAGHGGAALLVLVLGGIGLALLNVVIFKQIFRKGKSKPKNR